MLFSKVYKPVLLAAGLLLTLGACSSSSDNVLPPAELKPFTESLDVQRVWKVDTGVGNQGKYIKLEPLVVADKVLTVDVKGALSAHGLDDGKTVWKKDLDAVVTAGVGGGGFGEASLAIVGSEEGELMALSAIDGSERWTTELTSQVSAISEIDSGMLVARSIDGRAFGIDAETGDIKWTFYRETPALSLHGQGKPLIVHGGVGLGLDTGSVVMFTLATGEPIFELPLAAGLVRTEIERMVDIDGTLAFDDEELYAVTYQGRIAAIDARRGRVLWSHEASSATGVEVDGERLYYTDENSAVWALKKSSGNDIWKQNGLRFRTVTRPVLFEGTVVVGDYDGYVHWLDRDTGAFVQRVRASSEGILVAPKVNGDQLLVLGDDGVLSLWKVKH